MTIKMPYMVVESKNIVVDTGCSLNILCHFPLHLWLLAGLLDGRAGRVKKNHNIFSKKHQIFNAHPVYAFLFHDASMQFL